MRARTPIIALVVLSSCMLLTGTVTGSGKHGEVCQNQVVVPACPNSDCCTVLGCVKSGPLQLRAQGPNYSVLEIIFGETEYMLFETGGTSAICCNDVAVAEQKGDFGAFALRRGANRTVVTLFGRIPKTQEYTCVDIQLGSEQDGPLSVEWRTSRLVKVWLANTPAREAVFRLDEADKAWKQVAPTPGAVPGVRKWYATTLKWE